MVLTIKEPAAPPWGLPWPLAPTGAATNGVQRTGSRPPCSDLAQRGTLSPQTPNPIPGRDSGLPLPCMLRPDTKSKFSPIPFLFQGEPPVEAPPALTLPKNFISKNPAWGCVRRCGGIGAAGDGSGGPLASWQHYPWPSELEGPPLRAMMGL